jgi:hypothetical protein
MGSLSNPMGWGPVTKRRAVAPGRHDQASCGWSPAIAPWLLELSGWGRSAPPSAGALVSRLKRAVARQPFKLLDAMAA